MGVVVKLPTAARRKVRQDRWASGAFAANREALREAGKLANFPFEPRFEASPYMRKCEEQARLMVNANTTAALQIALAMFSQLDGEQRIKAKGRLIALGALNQAGAREALAWVDYEESGKAHKIQLNLAAQRLDERGGWDA